MRWLTCRSRCRLPSLDQRSPQSTRPMDRTLLRTDRNQDRLYTPGHSCSPDLRGAAVRGANSPTRPGRAGTGRSGCDVGCQSAPDPRAGDISRTGTGPADRFCARLCARDRRIRLGVVHLGKLAMRTELLPLLNMGKLEQFDYPGATAVAVLMLVISAGLLFGVNLLQRWSARRIAA